MPEHQRIYSARFFRLQNLARPEAAATPVFKRPASLGTEATIALALLSPPRWVSVRRSAAAISRLRSLAFRRSRRIYTANKINQEAEDPGAQIHTRVDQNAGNGAKQHRDEKPDVVQEAATAVV
jgi:hypothetical protein